MASFGNVASVVICAFGMTKLLFGIVTRMDAGGVPQEVINGNRHLVRGFMIGVLGIAVNLVGDRVPGVFTAAGVIVVVGIVGGLFLLALGAVRENRKLIGGQEKERRARKIEAMEKEIFGDAN